MDYLCFEKVKYRNIFYQRRKWYLVPWVSFLRKLGGRGGGGWGVSQSRSFGYLNYQCCKLPGTGYCMGIPYRVYRIDIPYRAYHTISYSKLRCHSSNVRQEYRFLLFIKAFISLYVF